MQYTSLLKTYGDTESYPHRLGLTEAEIARIKEKL